jgi:hypothetical protein
VGVVRQPPTWKGIGDSWLQEFGVPERAWAGDTEVSESEGQEPSKWK